MYLWDTKWKVCKIFNDKSAVTFSVVYFFIFYKYKKNYIYIFIFNIYKIYFINKTIFMKNIFDIMTTVKLQKRQKSQQQKSTIKVVP